MFSQPTLNQLARMKINGKSYYQDLLSKFNDDVWYFDELISKFKSASFNDGDKAFIKFCDCQNTNLNGNLGNYLKEMYDNLCRFNDDGLFGLFKKKQAEWGAPRVTLCAEDILEPSDINTLKDEVVIYRGMSKSEYDSKDFSQHWTTDLATAKRFTFDTYDDSEDKRVLISAKVKKENVICYHDLGECEIVPKAPVSDHIYDLTTVLCDR